MYSHGADKSHPVSDWSRKRVSWVNPPLFKIRQSRDSRRHTAERSAGSTPNSSIAFLRFDSVHSSHFRPQKSSPLAVWVNIFGGCFRASLIKAKKRVFDPRMWGGNKTPRPCQVRGLTSCLIQLNQSLRLIPAPWAYLSNYPTII